MKRCSTSWVRGEMQIGPPWDATSCLLHEPSHMAIMNPHTWLVGTQNGEANGENRLDSSKS